MAADENLKLGAFAAEVSKALEDVQGELALGDASFVRLIEEAAQMASPGEHVAIELLALCRKCLRLFGERADRACGQILFIVSILTNPAFAEDAGNALAGGGSVVGATRQIKPIGPAGSLANTPLGVYRSFKKK